MPVDDPSAAGSETSGPDDQGENTSLGVTGDGADDSGQDAGQDGETPSNDTQPKDTHEDGEDALIAALAAGKTDELDADGNKAKAKAPKVDEKPADKSEKVDEGEKKPEDAKPDEYEPDEKLLIEKARTKADRKDLDRLFKERRELRQARGFADGVIKHALEAKLVEATDKGLNTAGLYDLIETEKRVRALDPKGQAKFYRDLANKLHPEEPQQPAKPVELPQDLKDAVDAGYLKKEEADVIAEKRAPKPTPEAKKPEPTAEPAPQGPSAAESQQGFDAIRKLSEGYKERFGADWTAMAEKVQKRIAPLLKTTHPSGWKDVAELAMQAEAAERKQAVKKPVATTRPSGTPQKRTPDFLSEEEELEALSKGRSI